MTPKSQASLQDRCYVRLGENLVSATHTSSPPFIGSADRGFSLGAILGQAWSALLGVTDRLTDLVYDYVPADVSRPTVHLAVNAGLLLVLIGFARSILGFLLTVGTVVLGLFVASRVLGIEAGSGAIRPKGKRKGERWGSGRWK
ncbi:hypothetical protein WJX75_005640 [Coccomyxa subellipsoidea]|uniref:Uncharacterized protein n=1 Tax=Coccomyxa subellipsoidea TaxID=248742 RepID=A0ABR2YB08_9CHLO